MDRESYEKCGDIGKIAVKIVKRQVKMQDLRTFGCKRKTPESGCSPEKWLYDYWFA